MNTELVILKSLIQNEEYVKSVLPFLKTDYFQQESDKVLFNLIKAYITTYNKSPTTDALEIELDDKKGLREETVKTVRENLNTIKNNTEENNIDWLKSKTEEFCQDKALYNAIMQSINIIQDEKSKLSKGSIPSLLSDALAISFDTYIGHDFLENSDERYAYYHRKEERIPFDLEFFNTITKNGLPKRTLTVVMAGPNVGKSLWMTHNAAHFLTLGKNVLYISMEMREEELAKRIDCNLLNITSDDLEALSKNLFETKINKLRSKTNGKLIFKEYPSGSASTIHFRTLLNELKLKKGFTPDVIFIDYMNICASARMNLANTPKHYYVQAISEEFRAMATDYDVPVITATQVNREGFRSSEVGMENISESFGVNATADLLFYLQTNEVLESLGQLEVTQLKNRLNSKSKNRKFIIGVDYSKMKLYDVEDSAQPAQVKMTVVGSPVPAPTIVNRNNKFGQLKVT